jgi:hypothetical protein
MHMQLKIQWNEYLYHSLMSSLLVAASHALRLCKKCKPTDASSGLTLALKQRLVITS